MALALQCTHLKDAELYAQLVTSKTASLSQLATPKVPSQTVALSYVLPSQRPGSEASVAMASSHRFVLESLPSILSSLLPIPSWPNAPGIAGSIHAPSPGPSTRIDKGKQRASSTSLVDKFVFPSGSAGFQHNALRHAHWSLSRDVLHVSFARPLDDNLHAITHHTFRKFFNVSDDSIPTFIERPTISSVKWVHVPCFGVDNNEITKCQPANQILHQGLFAKLKVTNGKVCQTLLWVNQNSIPQCSQCLWWGHSQVSCQTNFSYCAVCLGCHMMSDHQNSIL